jgi:MFS family permease
MHPTDQPPRVSTAALIAAMIPVHVVAAACWFGLYTFVNGYVARGLGHTDATWTAMTLAFTGGLIFWCIVCSSISARIGRIATIALGLFVGALCYVAFAYVTAPAALAAIMFIASFVVAAVDAAWMPLVAEAGGMRPGRALALNMIGNTVVTMTLIATLGHLVDGGRFRFCFFVVAGLCMLSTAAFMITARALRSAEQSPVLPVLKLRRDDLTELAHGPFLILALTAILVEPFNFHTVNQLFPNLARAAHALSEQTISQIVAFGRLPALLTLIGIAAVIDRVNVVRAYGGAIVAVAAVIVAMSAVGSAAMLTGTYLLYYLSHGAVWGTNAAAVNATVRPRLRDSAFAITAIVMMFGQFLAGALHNRLLAAGFTLPTVFAASAAIAGGGAVVLIGYTFTARSRRRAERLNGC